MKRSICLLMVIALTLVFSSTTYAASSRRGKKVFNMACKSCHSRGGEAGKVSPSDKTMRGWERFIDKNRHNAAPKVIKKLSKKDLNNLRKFLLEYAIDADTTETCG